MRHRLIDTHLFEFAQCNDFQLTNADLHNNCMHNILNKADVTFSLALAPSLNSELLAAVGRRGAQLDNWLTITNQCWVPPFPPPLSSDLCTLTPWHWHQHISTEQLSTSSHTEKLDILIVPHFLVFYNIITDNLCPSELEPYLTLTWPQHWSKFKPCCGWWRWARPRP